MNSKKVFICNSKDYEKNSAFYCAGIVFDLEQTKLENVEEFITKTKKKDWIIVDYKNKENVIMDVRKECDFNDIAKYFSKKQNYSFLD